jgi:hypothetical protein
MPLATEYLVSDSPPAQVRKWAACLRKGLQAVEPRARVTISREGRIKISAPTKREISRVQEATARLERRCKL